MRVLLLAFCFVGGSWAAKNDLAPIFAENIYTRLWRTALTGPPTLGDPQGWPHYTQGAYNNTPQKGISPGTYVNTEASGWTSGFFADSLWQAYHQRTTLTDRKAYPGEPSAEEWMAMAEAWTEPLVTNSNVTDTHDLGFLAKPFESAMQIQDSDRYLPVLQNMSLNLAARFEPNAGVIRSWDCGNGGQRCSHEDSVLVIIDNMMVSGERQNAVHHGLDTFC
jgi:unsaturated chondroitin disaccharide hydrolase